MSNESVKILVVDDNEAGLYLKSRILEKAGYQVLQARTGREALEIIEQRKPVLAILDVRLPDMNGLDMCRQLKTSNSAVLILQTSATLIESYDRASGLDSGADAYLIEPMAPEELLATVNALLRVSTAEAKLRALNDTLEQRVQERTRDLEEANQRICKESNERRQAEATLRQLQKTEAIGQLTGGIAHDFNNLLTVMYGSLETIERNLRDTDKKVLLALEHAKIAARRAAALTGRLLAFARQQPLDPKVLNLNDLVKETAELLRRTLGEKIQLTIALAPTLLKVEVDSLQLENTLLNLAVNARDAMPDHGRLTITTAELCLNQRAEHWQLELPEGEYISICVTDTGKGMPAEILEKAFDPFFTFKPLGQGTGLGLSQVYGFVKQSGGHVRIASEVNQGTSVFIYLPRTDASLATTRPAVLKSEQRTSASTTVLLVEDDPAVREYGVDALKEMVYSVLIAEDSTTALAMLKAHPEISILFTDIGLPGEMNGKALAALAKKLYPALRVLYTTGYSQESIASRSQGGESFALLRKPFTYDDLAEKMRELAAV